MTDTATRQPLDIAAIRARADAASMGPWREGIDGNPRVYAKDNTEDAGCVATFMRRRDVHFCTEARSDIPALCDEVEALRAALERIAKTGDCVRELPDGSEEPVHKIIYSADLHRVCREVASAALKGAKGE